MKIPVVHGIIDRRILANYHIDPAVMAEVLPPPFRPQLANGFAIGGICLIRLKAIRPRFIPFPWGICSENVAHRVAVEWEVDGKPQHGVYIPRRDTESRIISLAGGKIFPGLHHHAQFSITESSDAYSLKMQSDDGETRVHVSGKVTDHLPQSSVFPSVTVASEFFEMGALGYSVTDTKGRFDALELCCKNWKVEPLEILAMESSYFENECLFPKGSVNFDCALLMRNIHHEWHSHKDLCCYPNTKV